MITLGCVIEYVQDRRAVIHEVCQVLAGARVSDFELDAHPDLRVVLCRRCEWVPCARHDSNDLQQLAFLAAGKVKAQVDARAGAGRALALQEDAPLADVVGVSDASGAAEIVLDLDACACARMLA